MKKQNGIIKLCVLMAFVSYFIWSNNEKKMSDQAITVNNVSSISQELNINEVSNDKINVNQQHLWQEEVKSSMNLILINDEFIEMRISI